MFKTGYRGKNKQGLDYEVVDGSKSKMTKIRFLVDGTERLTNKAYLSKGLPLHPTYGKYSSGQKFTTKKGDVFELVEKVSYTSWKIRFDDGVECTRETKAIKEGTVRHPTKGVPVVGEVYNSIHGNFTIVEMNSAIDIRIRFEDGVEHKTTTSAIRAGVVGHPTSGLHVGEKFKTNSGWKGEIIDYKSCYEVSVKWQDGSISSHEASYIKNGGIKPLYQPSVLGVGYYGEGRFSNGLKIQGETPPDEIYAYWVRMLNRCLNPKELMKNSGRRYLAVGIDPHWFCFQNFGEWAISQPNWKMGFELDKDLFGDGFTYSEDSCTFLPADINVFLAENWNKEVHDLPIGVQYIKPATKGAKIGYVSRCHTDKGREYLGYFDDPMDAYYAYKLAKEKYAKILANRFRDVLTEKAYVKLHDYTLDKVYSEPTYDCEYVANQIVPSNFETSFSTK